MTLIRIETDAGSTVAAASFVGDECFGVTKVERARQPGESRRVRRKAKAVEKAPRDPRAAAFLERANARVERQQEAIRAAVAIGATRVSIVESTPPVRETTPRARRRGDVLPISSLSPATLQLLEVGEPTTCVRKAA